MCCKRTAVKNKQTFKCLVSTTNPFTLSKCVSSLMDFPTCFLQWFHPCFDLRIVFFCCCAACQDQAKIWVLTSLKCSMNFRRNINIVLCLLVQLCIEVLTWSCSHVHELGHHPPFYGLQPILTYLCTAKGAMKSHITLLLQLLF